MKKTHNRKNLKIFPKKEEKDKDPQHCEDLIWQTFITPPFCTEVCKLLRYLNYRTEFVSQGEYNRGKEAC